LTGTGEMGVSLSGGQKSRISLARALYKKDSKIIMIDGTLSSLDARVAHKIINEIKNGEMFANKLVMLITYDLDQA
jgi:ABC-type multidrug transport system fused ATPase/permease subunit